VNKFLFFVLVGLWPVLLLAQKTSIETDTCNYKVEGFVLDLSTNKPLPYASVQIQYAQKGTTADENGYFQIKGLCRKEFDLIVSFVGYKTAIHHHDTYHQAPKIFLAPDSLTLESVTIEGDQLEGQLFSGTVRQLDTRTLEESKNLSLGDLASNFSGVSVLKTGQNVVKPVIHGLHSNRVLIVNNDVRHEFQNWGVEHAPEIDPSMIDNMSVVKGAATVKYGPDALGGVLVINPNPLDLLTPLNGELNLSANTNGRAGDGHIRLHKGFHKLSVQAQAAYTHQGDLQSPDYVLSNTGKREKSLSLGTRYHWKSLDLYAYYSHFDQELGILRGSVAGNLEDLALAIESKKPLLTSKFTYDINNPRLVVSHDVFKLKGVLSRENQSLEVVYALQNNHRQEFDVRRGINNESPAIDLELLSHSLDIEWQHPSLRDWDGSLGIQLVYQDNNNLPGTNTIPFVPNYNTYRAGVYLIESKVIHENRIEWGLRYDFQTNSIRARATNNDVYRNELVYQNLSATMGIVKPLAEGHIFRSNIGTAWRPPNVSELYSFGKHQASVDYGLWRYTILENGQAQTTDGILSEKEKAVPSEVGFKWINTYELNTDQFYGEATVYANYIMDFLYTRPSGIVQTVRGAFPFFVYDQSDALFAGLDASLSHQHTSNLDSELKFSYVWAKNLSEGAFFVGIPPINVQYEFRQDIPSFSVLDNFSWYVRLDYTFRQFQSPPTISVKQILEAEDEQNIFAENKTGFDFIEAPDAYLLAHVGMEGQFQRYTIRLRVSNLLNTSYRTYTDRLRYFADELGRSFELQINYQF